MEHTPNFKAQLIARAAEARRDQERKQRVAARLAELTGGDELEVHRVQATIALIEDEAMKAAEKGKNTVVINRGWSNKLDADFGRRRFELAAAFFDEDLMVTMEHSESVRWTDEERTSYTEGLWSTVVSVSFVEVPRESAPPVSIG